MANGSCSPPRFARRWVSRVGTSGRVDDYLKKLIELDQRVHVMALELREAPPRRPTWPTAACWTRRCSTASRTTKRRRRSCSTSSRSTRTRAPTTTRWCCWANRCSRRATIYSARHYLQEAVAKNTGSKPEQQALQRLVEISLRTGDYENVDCT